jgi:glycerophosphoryl diester phosphodiesterase
MIVLAHRGLHNGPNSDRENTSAAVTYCFERGWGVEVDIRRSRQGRFYFSHDSLPLIPPEHDALECCRAIRQLPLGVMALNVKELGYEAELLQFLDAEKVLDRVFLFDMELIEPHPGHTASRLRHMCPAVSIAARVSDRNEPLERALGISEAAVIWLDEFDSLWVTRADVARLKSGGKTVYAVSPELHGFDSDSVERRWRSFAAWGVDGICTDYPARLSAELRGSEHEDRAS